MLVITIISSLFEKEFQFPMSLRDGWELGLSKDSELGVLVANIPLRESHSLVMGSWDKVSNHLQVSLGMACLRL